MVHWSLFLVLTCLGLCSKVVQPTIETAWFAQTTARRGLQEVLCTYSSMHAQEDAPAHRAPANGSSPLLFWRRIAKPQRRQDSHSRAASTLPSDPSPPRQAAAADSRGPSDALDGVDDLMSQLAEQQVLPINSCTFSYLHAPLLLGNCNILTCLASTAGWPDRQSQELKLPGVHVPCCQWHGWG